MESGDPNSIGQVIVPIPQNYSLINQAGMCLDASNNPVMATWWAPGSGTNNYQRQYMVVFPDTNGVWQTRQISNRTNDPPGTMELDAVVRDLGRPVVVCDKAEPHHRPLPRQLRQQWPDRGVLAALRDGSRAHELDDDQI